MSDLLEQCYRAEGALGDYMNGQSYSSYLDLSKKQQQTSLKEVIAALGPLQELQDSSKQLNDKILDSINSSLM